MADIDFIAIGNDELDNSEVIIGDSVTCPNCKKLHDIAYGTNEKGEISKKLAFVKCPENNKLYLAGIGNKVLDLSKRGKEGD